MVKCGMIQVLDLGHLKFISYWNEYIRDIYFWSFSEVES